MIASKLLFSVKNGGSSTQEDHTTIQFEVGEPEKNRGTYKPCLFSSYYFLMLLSRKIIQVYTASVGMGMATRL
jgi:hypothetical protein